MPSALERMEQLFHAAAALEPAARGRFLDDACQGDPDLRRQLDLMLGEHDVGTRGVLSQVPSESVELPDPITIGPFRIIRLLGQGGMGRVYEAEQDTPRRSVAIKVLSESVYSVEARRRFAREAQVLADLKHPGIAQVYQTGVAPDDLGRDRVYIAMELVRGQPVGVHAEARKLSIRDRCELVARICDAVQHAHQRGIIHRDLKPANILVESTDLDPIGQPKVLDFGIARLQGLGKEGLTDATESGRVLGTLAYMSPEQIENSALVDTRSDVYALGVIGYELLAKVPPLDLSGTSLASAARKLRDVEPVPLGRIERSCRGDLETIFRKALAKERDRRYAGVGELAEDLRRAWRHEPISARPPTATYQLRKFAQRNRGVFVSLLLAATSLVAATIVSSVALVQARRDRQRAVDGQRAAETANALAAIESQNLRQSVTFFSKGILFQSYGSDQGRTISIIDALRRADSRISSGLANDPLTEARLRYNIGLVYIDDHDFAAAEAQMTRSVELFRQFATRFGDEDRMIRLHLARVVRELGQLDRALAIARAVVDDSRAAGDRWVLANSLGQLGLGLADAGDDSAALATLNEGVDIVCKLEPTRPTRWIGPMHRVVMFHVQRNDLAAALAAANTFDAALAGCTAAPADAIPVARSQLFAALGQELQAIGEPDAWRHFSRAHAILQKGPSEPALRAAAAIDCVLAIDDVDPSAAKPDLATTRAALLADASDQLLQVPDNAASRGPLEAHLRALKCRLLATSGSVDQALELLGPPTDSTTLPTASPDPTRTARAFALSVRGDHERACTLIHQELEARVNLSGPTLPETCRALAELIAIFDRADKADDATQIAANLLLQLRDSPNRATPDFVHATINIARMLAAHKRAAQGIAAIDAILPHITPAAHPSDKPLPPLASQARRARAALAAAMNSEQAR